MRYLVTGGAGFIGSHLVDALLNKGHDVTVLDDLSTGHRKNLAHVSSRIAFNLGDLRSPADVASAVVGCAGVFHQAAIPSVPRSMKDPLTTHEVNVTGTVNLLWAAHQAGVKRVVFASSSSVYGDTPELPKREDMQPLPKSPYAASKLAGEIYAAAFGRAFSIETVGLRYFNVFGPRQDPDSAYAAVIPNWLARIRDGKAPVIYGDGTQSRDFTFVENVVNANLRAMEVPELSGAVFNIAAGQRVVLLDVAQAVIEACAYSGTPEYTERRAGDIEHSFADTSCAVERLGYRTATSWQDGLRRTVEWFNSVGNA